MVMLLARQYLPTADTQMRPFRILISVLRSAVCGLRTQRIHFPASDAVFRNTGFPCAQVETVICKSISDPMIKREGQPCSVERRSMDRWGSLIIKRF